MNTLMCLDVQRGTKGCRREKDESEKLTVPKGRGRGGRVCQTLFGATVSAGSLSPLAFVIHVHDRHGASIVSPCFPLPERFLGLLEPTLPYRPEVLGR